MDKAKTNGMYMEAMEEDKNKVRQSDKLRVEKQKAWEYVNTRKGYWRII